MQLTLSECLALMGGHLPPPSNDYAQMQGYWALFVKRLYDTYGERDASSVLLLAGGMVEPWDTSWHDLAVLNSRASHDRKD